MQRIQSETVRNLELVLRDDNIMDVELEGTTVLQAFYQKEPRPEDISNFMKYAEDYVNANFEIKQRFALYDNITEKEVLESQCEHARFRMEIGEDLSNHTKIFAECTSFLNNGKFEVEAEITDKTGRSCVLDSADMEIVKEQAKDVAFDILMENILPVFQNPENSAFFHEDFRSIYLDHIQEAEMDFLIHKYLEEDTNMTFPAYLSEAMKEKVPPEILDESIALSIKHLTNANIAAAVFDNMESRYGSLTKGLQAVDIPISYDASFLVDNYQLNLMIENHEHQEYSITEEKYTLSECTKDILHKDIAPFKYLLELSGQECAEKMDSALMQLIYTQEYFAKDIFREIIDKDNTESAVIRGAGAALRYMDKPYAEPALTAAVCLDKTNLDVITALKKQEGCIILPRKTQMVLFDKENGYESKPFQLEKGFVIPARQTDGVPSVRYIQVFNEYTMTDSYENKMYESPNIPDNLQKAIFNESLEEQILKEFSENKERMTKDLHDTIEYVMHDLSPEKIQKNVTISIKELTQLLKEIDSGVARFVKEIDFENGYIMLLNLEVNKKDKFHNFLCKGRLCKKEENALYIADGVEPLFKDTMFFGKWTIEYHNMKFTATVNGPEREKKNKVYVHEFDVQDNEKEPAMKNWDKLRYLEEVKDARTKAYIYDKKNRDRER